MDTQEIEAPAVSTEPPAEANGSQPMFTFSVWVHVGPGAEDCEAVDEDAGTVDCSNPLHFHAWCRLPNQFQHREIREKATGAKARRSRQLRDEGSDAYAVLEDELDDLRRLGEELARPSLTDELVARDWWRDYLEAVKDVEDEEGDDGEKIYGQVNDDRRRMQELLELPADDRPQAEFEELTSHLAAYEQAIDAKTKELQEPRRAGYDAKDFEELLTVARDQRIESEAMDEFTHVYSTWMWFYGTLAQAPQAGGATRRFQSVEQMQEAAPEIVNALQQAYQDLEKTFQQGRVPGN